MLGLVKKDFFMVKSNLKTILIILAVFGFMAWQGESDLSFIAVLTTVMVFMSTFSYDEYNKFNAYVICLPNGKDNMVKAKYIASLLLMFVAVVVTSLANLAIGYFKHNLDLESTLSMVLGSVFACVLIQSIVFPLMFKFGVEKGRIALFVGAFVFSGIFVVLFKSKAIHLSPALIHILDTYFPLILIAVLVLLTLGSYFISRHIVDKKEF